MPINHSLLQTMQPEMALLIACSSSELDEADKAFIATLLQSELNWDVVFRNGVYHKVIPLLHKRLTVQFKEQLSEQALASLNIYARQSALSTLVISGALLNVVGLLNKHDIGVLPVKGGILAEKLYGSPTMRSYTDVDILVPEDEVEHSLQVLQSNGYTLLPGGIANSTYLKFLKDYHHGRLLDPNGVLIELHWELSGFYAPTPMTYESIKAQLTSTVFNHRPIQTLTDEMLFLFLCLHGSKHSWAKLDYISSIAKLLSNTPHLNWDTILNQGTTLKMQKRITLILILLEKLYAISPPDAFKEATQGHSKLNKIAVQIIHNEFGFDTALSTIHPMKKITLYQPTIMDSKLDATRFILRSFIVPEHEVWYITKLPDSLFWLYYFHKPYRFVTRPFRKMF